MTAPTVLLAAKSTLVVAHPGQELPILGWLELVRPQVHILTSGTRAGGEQGIAASGRLVDALGAKRGAMFGRLTEAELYTRLLIGDARFACTLADELAAAFVAQKLEFVVGPAADGAHVANDLLRAVIDAAAEQAGAKLGRPVLSYEFTALASADDCPAELRHRSLRLALYDEAFERKLEAAAQYRPLASEVRAALAAAGLDAFRVECFWPSRGVPAAQVAPARRPWEVRAEALVAAGVYAEAIRYREHIAPLVAQLQGRVKQAA